MLCASSMLPCLAWLLILLSKHPTPPQWHWQTQHELWAQLPEVQREKKRYSLNESLGELFSSLVDYRNTFRGVYRFLIKPRENFSVITDTWTCVITHKCRWFSVAGGGEALPANKPAISGHCYHRWVLWSEAPIPTLTTPTAAIIWALGTFIPLKPFLCLFHSHFMLQGVLHFKKPNINTHKYKYTWE